MVKTVSLPKPAPDLLLLHIELKWITPTIWRRFVVPENITLGKLHHVIQVVMGWSDS
ncbi:TPA: plasmid pRiA4b ORF-3 family protein, partial [Pseudomonas aeruginosa]|nr:plasmid pRiA4b ORF-3 family protein [Pseudomonas aeruginosa]HEJ2879736.1 plasmid pRiA4b ORF-3 family protein [Pseudomonas aeruginosa]HEJ3056697.1 plasmid pRiA4b ORF-3 family protein [Pseudomonas aeruginosa]HEJ3069991.1 plasmid pRiA4b ORF-3 family protein [Pseudomonas aeruginosa]HEJ3737662.1 plasmid pRiA4b ORF-3 family protein [Pseudomonas aeruginosa]